MNDFKSILHPDREPSVAELLSKISALESADQKLALRGGSAVDYDINGFIETLNVGSLSAGVVLVGGAAADVNSGLVEITPGKVLISGSTQLSDWRHSSNQTLIDGGDIFANSVTANQIGVVNLAAINADLGTVTAGTITGLLIKTSASGQRIEITSANLIKFYDSGGTSRAQIFESAGDFYLTAQFDIIFNGDKLHLDTGNLQVDSYGSFGGNLNVGGVLFTDDIDDDGQGFVEIRDDLFINGNMTTADWVAINGDLDMENHNINDVNTLNATTKNFLIPHPDGSKRLLKYTAVEAPEVAVYYRGIIKLTSPQEFVAVPKHFEQVTESEGLVTVQITPINSSPVHIVERPTHKGFTVSGAVGTEIMFEIKAIRKGYLDNAVEIDLENPTSDFGKNYVANKKERAEVKEEMAKKREKKYSTKTDLSN